MAEIHFDPNALEETALQVVDEKTRLHKEFVHDTDREFTRLDHLEDALYFQSNELHEQALELDGQYGIWNTAKRAFDYFQASKFLIAANMSSPGGLMLLLAGGLGLGTRLVEDITSWRSVAQMFTDSDEKAESLAKSLEKYLFWINLGTSVGISFFAQNLLNRVESAISKAFSVTVALFQGGIGLKTQQVQNQLAYVQAKQRENNTNLTLIDDERTKLTDKMTESFTQHDQLVGTYSSVFN